MKPLGFNILSIAILLLAAGCSSSRQSQGSDKSDKSQAKAIWQSKPLTIDGNDQDWVKPLPYVVHEENVNYSISNDQQNLYILLSTSSRQEQQKIIQGGMSVWVNTKGDQSNGDAVGIGYPLDERSDPDRKLMEEAQPQRYQNKPVTLADKRTYSLYGFSKDSTIKNYTYGDSNSVGVIMRLDYNNKGDLIYEASIPLQALYPGHDPATPYTTRDLAVGIFIQALPPSARIPREGGGGGRPGLGFGVGGGMGGFGGPGLAMSGIGMGVGIGGGRGGMGRTNRNLYDDAQIWQEVQLARK
ncbi:MAG TPA: hypothetical protein VL978_03965 [Puia sp.]|nr:hypothetical protein [Puia sp.]